MSDDEIKEAVLLLMGDVLDETSLPGATDSFVEMSRHVVHVVADGREMYLRVRLESVGEQDYRL